MFVLKTYIMSIRWVLDYTADEVLSDVNFRYNNSLINFQVITKTTEHRSKEYTSIVKQTNMTSAHLFIESEKLAQADDEFAKQLKVCAKTWGNITFTVNAESDAFLISFHTYVILRYCWFSVQTFFIG